MKVIVTIFLMSLTLLQLKAQYYFLGSARNMAGGCIQLTPDMPYAEGIAYNKYKLNLDDYFEIQFDIYLGKKDEGADGVTFVIHNDIRGFDAFGQWGECMGYGRFNPFSPGNSIDPSIAIEFDTYQNTYQNDPYCDHIAYLENGISRHDYFWNDDNDDFDLEDDKMHDFRFRWDPEMKKITVYWDGVIVYEGTKDLREEIFEGEKEVIWGFTASTGRAHNLQYFCLRRLTLNKSDLNRQTYKSD